MRNFAPKHFSTFAFLGVMALAILPGCSKQNNIVKRPLVIWTDRSEFASYAELFNLTHEDQKAVVVYKSNPAQAIETGHYENPPDIVIGTALKNEKTRRDFYSLNFLFTERQLNPEDFYPNLLEAGKTDGEQYLLPVSFNIPAVMFSIKQSHLINDTYMLSIDQIRDIAGIYNVKNKSGSLIQIGFAPSWEPDFLYLVTQMMGTSYMQKGREFTWNEKGLSSSIEYLQSWTKSKNISTTVESDFDFKYLYTPKYKQITSNRCLFAYVMSDELFEMNEEQLQNIDFRWIHQNHKIPVADNLVSMGIYKHSMNSRAAEIFITWFMNDDTQKQILDKGSESKLNTSVFGIAGGFSSVKNVTEKFFPLTYRLLLGNLPLGEYLDARTILPPRWNAMKQKVVIPYITEASSYKLPEEDDHKYKASLAEMLDNWKKQNY